jgi:tripartite-type tricarboxylate transporter receptor subunit TctC
MAGEAMPDKLDGKAAAVTGAATGIGQAFARRLAEDGANIVIADISPTEDTMRLVESAGRQGLACRCDVTSPDDVANLAAQVRERFGGCNILVNSILSRTPKMALVRRSLLHCSMIALLASAVAGANAQTVGFPNRPVQIVLDAATGASPDVGLRFVAEELSRIWGQQVVAVNRPGAGGSLAVRAVANAAPDGYTLYQAVLSTFAPLQPVAPHVPVQVPQDFLPVGFVTEIPMFIAASPTLGISSMPELIALAKQRPGTISYAVTGVGRLTHLTGELLQQQAGIKLFPVPYKGGPAQAFGDVTSGRVDLVIDGYSSLAGAVNSGSLKLLAVCLDKRLPDFPDLPTVAEALPGFRATGWAVLLAPLGTPEPIVRKISEDLYKVTSEPGLQKRLATLGTNSNPMTASETTNFITTQQQLWEPILSAIRAQKP